MSAPRPYLGITGFMTRAEVDAALAALPDIGRPLMVGVLASSKTIVGQINKYPRRYPKARDIERVFSPDPRCLNLVHYATGGERDCSVLAMDLKLAMERGGPLCHGVQVNATWPPVRGILFFREAFPDARVVLQLGPGAMASMQHKALAIVDRVRDDYRDAVTDVLVDVSGGRGLPIDPDAVKFLLDAIMDHGAWGVGVAGGLCAETLLAIGAALGNFAGVSVDAEGRLRDDSDGGGNLDPDKVRAYLSAAVSVMADASRKAGDR